MTDPIGSLLALAAINGCAAVVLALGTALCGRWVKRPGLMHLLWILVLLELLTPPLLEVGIVPRPALAPAASQVATSPAGIAETAEQPLPAQAPATVASSWTLTETLPAVLAVIWAAGALVVLLLVVVRLRRFDRALGPGVEPAAALSEASRRLARRLGLKRCPSIRLVSAPISPMLRPRLGSLEVLFPAALVARLTGDERDALLAHELAHVKRRDHWVRFLELIAGALFWWHPVVWWARARLRRVEERCCDDLVLATLPGRERAYAEGLVKTVEFLADSRMDLPCVACGIGGARILEERLTMILKRRVSKSLSLPARLALAVMAAALLLVLPTWADQKEQEEQQDAAGEAEFRESMLALEEHAQQLEMELRQVRIRQRELAAGMRRQYEDGDIERLAAEAAASEAWRREQVELEHQRARIDMEFERARMAEEAALQRLQQEAELSQVRGERDRVADAERHAAETRVRMELLERETQQRLVQLEQEMSVAALDRLRREIDLLVETGDNDEALRLKQKLVQMQIELGAHDQKRQQADRLRELEQSQGVR